MTRILVFGSLNADLLLDVAELPGRGETTIGSNFRRLSGGKGGNQAYAAARLAPDETPVLMIARVGDDEAGTMLRDDLAMAGADVTHVAELEGHPSGIAMITVDHQGANTIVVAPGANAVWDDVTLHDVQIGSGDFVVVQLEIPVETVRALVRHAVDRGARVVLNAAPANAGVLDVLPLADVLIVNEIEAEQLLGISDANLVTAATARAALGGDLVITRGADGVIVSERSGVTSDIPAFRVDAIDTVGAGDAFVGGLVAALAAGADLSAAARFANASGALTATAPGARNPHLTRPLLDEFMEGR